MEREEYARIARVEDDHWWYRNTRGLVADLLAPWLTSERRILDAGCGPGGNGAGLAGHGSVIGVDVSDDALRFVAERRPTVPVRASVTALPFPAELFDVVVAITVLYSVEDDVLAVRELARVLRCGGALLVMEPAFEALRRAHDVAVHGRRRYRLDGLTRLVRAAGLHPRRTTYAYSFLAPVAATLAAADRLCHSKPAGARSDVERRTLDQVFAPLAHAERRLLRTRDVPVGTSAFVLATKD